MNRKKTQKIFFPPYFCLKSLNMSMLRYCVQDHITVLLCVVSKLFHKKSEHVCVCLFNKWKKTFLCIHSLSTLHNGVTSFRCQVIESRVFVSGGKLRFSSISFLNLLIFQRYITNKKNTNGLPKLTFSIYYFASNSQDLSEKKKMDRIKKRGPPKGLNVSLRLLCYHPWLK